LATICFNVYLRFRWVNYRSYVFMHIAFQF
jgi:hypothetical protein